MNERLRRGSVQVAAMLLAAATLSAQAKPEAEKAGAQVTVTGCLVRTEGGAGDSGTPVTADGGYVLQVFPAGEAAASVEARAAKPTGDAARQPRAYRLVCRPAPPRTFLAKRGASSR
jgi:hypothetical protein